MRGIVSKDSLVGIKHLTYRNGPERRLALGSDVICLTLSAQAVSFDKTQSPASIRHADLVSDPAGIVGRTWKRLRLESHWTTSAC